MYSKFSKVIASVLVATTLISTVMSDMVYASNIDDNSQIEYQLDLEDETVVDIDAEPEEELNENETDVETVNSSTAVENIEEEDIVEDAVETAVYTINFYAGDEIIVSEEYEENSVIEFPDMSNDETFLGWQIKVDDDNLEDVNTESEEYIVTSDVDFYAVFEEKEETELEETELKVEIDGYTITATGNMPENAELSVIPVDEEETMEYDEKINETLSDDVVYKSYVAFDIDILVDGEKWQPVDFDELVKISIQSAQIEEKKEEVASGIISDFDEENEEVLSYANVDDLEDTVYRIDAETEEIVEMVIDEENTDEKVVEFETEHFTIYSYGGTSYNTTSATKTISIGTGYTAYLFSDGLFYIVGSGTWKNSFYTASGISDSTLKTSIKKVVFACSEPTNTNIDYRIDHMFSGCTNLEKIEFTGTFTGKNAYYTYDMFSGCTNLTELILPDGFGNNSSNQFRLVENLKGLKKLYLPASIYTKYTSPNITGNSTTLFSSASQVRVTPKTGSSTVMTPAQAKTKMNTVQTVGYTYEAVAGPLFTFNSKSYYESDATATYTAGTNVKAYWYASDGVLGFVGAGAMNNWTSSSVPWASIKSNIKGVYIDNKITTIGNYTFYNHSAITKINALPTALTSIGNSAFDGTTSLTTTITLPSTITTIGTYAFYNTRATITGSLPSSLKTIGTWAFGNAVNTKITGSIPASVTSIGTKAFYGVDTTKTYFSTNLSSVNVTAAMNIPTFYTVVHTFTDGKGSVTTTKYGFVGATSACGAAPTFSGYTLKTDCTNTAITIGSTASNRLKLTRVYEPDLPEGCIKKWEIGKPTLSDVIAYLYYYNGTDETNGYKLVLEGTGATEHFTSSSAAPWYNNYGSLIKEVEIKEGITYLGNYLFKEHTALSHVGFPNSLNLIGEYAFAGCSALANTGAFPSNVYSIGQYAFSGCTNLAFSGDLPANGSNATTQEGIFQYCKNVAFTGTMPNYSGKAQFRGVDPSKTHFDIVNGNWNITNYTNATSCYLPTSCEIICKDENDNTIGNFTEYGFIGNTVPCSKTIDGYELVSSKAYSAGEEISKNIFLAGETSNVKTQIINTYAECDGWTKRVNIGYPNLEDVAAYWYPASANGGEKAKIKIVGTGATKDFELSSGSTYIFGFSTATPFEVEISEGITELGDYIFYNISSSENNLCSANLPSTLKRIGKYAFGYCRKLVLTGDIPANVTNIGSSAFSGVDITKTHFDRNLSSVIITKDMSIPTSYTVVDTFTDGKASVTTTKYGMVGLTASVSAAPTYEGYKLKPDCTNATITIGSTDEDRLKLQRIYDKILPSWHLAYINTNGNVSDDHMQLLGCDSWSLSFRSNIPSTVDLTFSNDGTVNKTQTLNQYSNYSISDISSYPYDMNYPLNEYFLYDVNSGDWKTLESSGGIDSKALSLSYEHLQDFYKFPESKPVYDGVTIESFEKCGQIAGNPYSPNNNNKDKIILSGTVTMADGTVATYDNVLVPWDRDNGYNQNPPYGSIYYPSSSTYKIKEAQIRDEGDYRSMSVEITTDMTKYTAIYDGDLGYYEVEVPVIVNELGWDDYQKYVYNSEDINLFYSPLPAISTYAVGNPFWAPLPSSPEGRMPATNMNGLFSILSKDYGTGNLILTQQYEFIDGTEFEPSKIQAAAFIDVHTPDYSVSESMSYPKYDVTILTPEYSSAKTLTMADNNQEVAFSYTDGDGTEKTGSFYIMMKEKEIVSKTVKALDYEIISNPKKVKEGSTITVNGEVLPNPDAGKTITFYNPSSSSVKIKALCDVVYADGSTAENVWVTIPAFCDAGANAGYDPELGRYNYDYSDEYWTPLDTVWELKTLPDGNRRVSPKFAYGNPPSVFTVNYNDGVKDWTIDVPVNPTTLEYTNIIHSEPSLLFKKGAYNTADYFVNEGMTPDHNNIPDRLEYEYMKEVSVFNSSSQASKQPLNASFINNKSTMSTTLFNYNDKVISCYSSYYGFKEGTVLRSEDFEPGYFVWLQYLDSENGNALYQRAYSIPSEEATLVNMPDITLSLADNETYISATFEANGSTQTAYMPIGVAAEGDYPEKEVLSTFSVKLPASINVTGSNETMKHFGDFTIQAKGNKSKIMVTLPNAITLTGKNTTETFDLNVSKQNYIFKPILSAEDVNTDDTEYAELSSESYSAKSGKVSSNEDPTPDVYEGGLTVTITSED